MTTSLIPKLTRTLTQALEPYLINGPGDGDETRSNLTELELTNLLNVFTDIHRQMSAKYQSSLHSLDAALGRMRKVVWKAVHQDRTHAVYKLAMQVLNVSREQRQELRDEQQQRLETANGRVYSFDEQRVREVLATLSQSDADEDADGNDAVLLLMLESGLRMIEVLYTANVELAPTPASAPVNSSWVKVTGLAKSKAQPDKCVTKPLLTISYESFRQRLVSVREQVARKSAKVVADLPDDPDVVDVEGDTRKAITNIYNHQVNKRVRKHLGPHTSHIARKIYGALSYEWYGKARGQSLNSWLQLVMGHRMISTSLSYSNVVVVKSDAAGVDPATASSSSSSSSSSAVSDEVLFFAKKGARPIDLDQLLVRVGDVPARARWLSLLQRHFRNLIDYTLDADAESNVGGGVSMSIWCALGLMEKSGRPRALDMVQRMRGALLAHWMSQADDIVRESDSQH